MANYNTEFCVSLPVTSKQAAFFVAAGLALDEEATLTQGDLDAAGLTKEQLLEAVCQPTLSVTVTDTSARSDVDHLNLDEGSIDFKVTQSTSENSGEFSQVLTLSGEDFPQNMLGILSSMLHFTGDRRILKIAYANTCSQMVPGGFGGGLVTVSAEGVSGLYGDRIENATALSLYDASPAADEARRRIEALVDELVASGHNRFEVLAGMQKAVFNLTPDMELLPDVPMPAPSVSL